MSFALSDETKRTLQNDMVRAQSVCINFLLDDRILNIPLGILAVLEEETTSFVFFALFHSGDFSFAL